MPKSTLKTTAGRRAVDVRPDRLDLRDRPYRPPLVSLPAEYPSRRVISTVLRKYQAHQLVLDQGMEGACTGFGLAAVVNFLLWRRENIDSRRQPAKFRPVTRVSPRMLYHLARMYDEWGGEDYEGSSCRGAVKGWHRHGVCSETLWPYRDKRGREVFVEPKKGWTHDAATRTLGTYYRVDRKSVADMQSAIHEVGAVYCSAEVHDGWNLDSSKTLPVIEQQWPVSGGHAFALVGYNKDGFIVQNSWGPDWGYGGFAVLTYRDWVANGMDCWVAVMGVPVEHPATGTARSSLSLSAAAAGVVTGTAPAIARAGSSAGATAPFDEEQAYLHTLVLANDGRPANRLVSSANAEAAVKRVCLTGPARWLRDNPGGAMALYVHGGLNSEEDAMKRVRILAPYFKANGIYPLFVAWRTGIGETLKSILDDALGTSSAGPRAEGWMGDAFDRIEQLAGDAKDRTIEVGAEKLLGKAVWQQMKQNAAASAEDRGGTALLAGHLATLAGGAGAPRLHVVAHSAGSILLGHLFTHLRDARSGVVIQSTTLYAPACTTRFAVDHYAAAAHGGLLRPQSVFIENLDDERERADSVGPYGKSLLYLISRALESYHKTPLLGLHIARHEKPDRDGSYWPEKARAAIKEGNDFLRSHAQIELHGRDQHPVDTGAEPIDLAHGSFDNDRKVITRTLERIREGEPLVHAVGSLGGF